jgi:hypothetical protein
MKYAGRTVKKPRYKLGMQVRVLQWPKKPIGRITKDEYREFHRSWYYIVKIPGDNYPKWHSEKNLRKVRSDAKKR